MTSFNATIAGRRRHHFQIFSTLPTGLATIGLSSIQFCKSSASPLLVAYLCSASLRSAFRQIVSRSRGMDGLSVRGRTGSLSRTCRKVSATVDA